jgi:hypothetical protein
MALTGIPDCRLPFGNRVLVPSIHRPKAGSLPPLRMNSYTSW